jgi:hypothetical protein
MQCTPCDLDSSFDLGRWIGLAILHHNAFDRTLLYESGSFSMASAVAFASAPARLLYASAVSCRIAHPLAHDPKQAPHSLHSSSPIRLFALT